jgi:hypothetical protein
MGCIPAGMEWFPAETDEQWKVIRRVINDCDFYVLIIGGRYGSTTSEGLSYTEKEFDYAVTKMPVLVFCHQDPSSIPLGRSETEPKLRKSLKAFRKKAMTGRLVKFWTSADGLASQVSLAIHNTIQTHDAIGWVRGGLHSLDAPYGKTPGGGSEWNDLTYTRVMFSGNCTVSEQRVRWSIQVPWTEVFREVGILLSSSRSEAEIRNMIGAPLIAKSSKYASPYWRLVLSNVYSSRELETLEFEFAYPNLADDDFALVEDFCTDQGLVTVENKSPGRPGEAIWSLSAKGKVVSRLLIRKLRYASLSTTLAPRRLHR